jgi:hypothetical protein
MLIALFGPFCLPIPFPLLSLWCRQFTDPHAALLVCCQAIDHFFVCALESFLSFLGHPHQQLLALLLWSFMVLLAAGAHQKRK